MSYLRSTINIEPATVDDVLTGGKREVLVTVDGVASRREIPATDNFAVVDSVRNAACQLLVVDTDASGNPGAPSDPFAWTATDQSGPPKPATPSLLSVEQIEGDLTA